MTLTEVLPDVQSLSRNDKLQLLQLLASELDRDVGNVIEPGGTYPVWSPDQAFGAAQALLKALEDEKRRP